MAKSNVPARLEIKDLPRDNSRALGGLRGTLCASFNYCRRYPVKLELLKQTLKVVYNQISAYQKAVAAEEERVAKLSIEAEAAELGFDVDSRKTVDNMKADLEAFKAKTEEEQAEAKAKLEAKLAKIEEEKKVAEAEAKVKAAEAELAAITNKE